MNDKSRALYDRATKLIPGGVNSPVRAFKAVGGDPLFIREADGPYVVDAGVRSAVDFDHVER